MIIYKITNIINGKVYIGQTIRNLEQRFKEHCTKPRCLAIHTAIIKYGAENFSVETVETVSSLEELNNREQFWISEFNSLSPNGYNLCSGGMNGRISSESTKLKQSDFMKGKIGDSHPSFGHKKSEEWKKRQSDFMRNKEITPEIRKNMSAAAKLRKTNVRPCFLISDSGEKLEFISLKDAGKFLGCTGCNLNYYIKKNKPIKNYTIVVKGK